MMKRILLSVLLALLIVVPSHVSSQQPQIASWVLVDDFAAKDAPPKDTATPLKPLFHDLGLHLTFNNIYIRMVLAYTLLVVIFLVHGAKTDLSRFGQRCPP